MSILICMTLISIFCLSCVLVESVYVLHSTIGASSHNLRGLNRSHDFTSQGKLTTIIF